VIVEARVMTRVSIFCMKKKNYAGSEKPLPTLIKEKEPLWYRVTSFAVRNMMTDVQHCPLIFVAGLISSLKLHRANPVFISAFCCLRSYPFLFFLHSD
jgi:hypothetical protein